MATANAEIRELKDQIAGMEKALKAHVKETGNGFSGSKVEHLAHRAGEDLREFTDHKREQLVHLRDEASEQIARRPLSSTAAAFGAGVLLSMLLRR
jgi:ElaB/YqjD/DUF883 family membrane-anchored ribosome-binding protein